MKPGSGIFPGCLCLIVGDHSLAGNTCTAVSYSMAIHAFTTHRATGLRREVAGEWFWYIAAPCIPIGERGLWVARPHHLIPLTPPPGSVDEQQERNKVTDSGGHTHCPEAA